MKANSKIFTPSSRLKKKKKKTKIFMRKAKLEDL